MKEHDLKTRPITLLFDIETNEIQARIREIHCIVLYHVEGNKFYRFNDQQLSHPVVRAVQYLQDADRIIGHNIIGFDIPAIKEVYPFFNPLGEVVDTLLLSRLYHPNMLELDKRVCRDMPTKLYGRHSLESYGHRLGEYKGDYCKTADWKEWSQAMEDYCQQDVVVTKKLWKHFQPYLIGSN